MDKAGCNATDASLQFFSKHLWVSASVLTICYLTGTSVKFTIINLPYIFMFPGLMDLEKHEN